MGTLFGVAPARGMAQRALEEGVDFGGAPQAARPLRVAHHSAGGDTDLGVRRGFIFFRSTERAEKVRLGVAGEHRARRFGPHDQGRIQLP